MNGLLFISHSASSYSTADSIEIALRGGCRQIQLRMKRATEEEVFSVGTIVKQMCDRYGAKLYIDDHPSVCKRLQAAGVHLGKYDMPLPEARKLLGDGYIIGGTANTFEDICHLSAAGADYIGLGPFRYTTTKKNLSPFLGLEGYRTILKQCRENGIVLPVVAIGGIIRDDIPALMDTGVTGIALSSAILQAVNPVEETAYLIEQIKQHTI